MEPRQGHQSPTETQHKLISGGFIALVLVAIIAIGGYKLGWDWTGLTQEVTFWDWLKVLALPITVGGAVPVLNWLQKRRELDIEDQRGQDAALQAYLDQVSELLTDKGRPLHRARPGDQLSMVARARTLTILSRLDGVRKGSIVRFLYESGLIDGKAGPVISLKDADLRGADLEWALLSDADLSGANLEGVILVHANLTRVNFERAYLQRARLASARLPSAFLRGAFVTDAVFIGAELTNAQLRWARLENTNLQGAYLSKANLRGANLSKVDLSGAKGITKKQLATCASLVGATMPDGKKYGDWLEANR